MKKKQTVIKMLAGIFSFFFWFSFPLFSFSLLYFVPSSRWISCLLSCRIINPKTLISCSPFAAETAPEDSHVWLWNQLSRSLTWLLQKLSREGERKKGTLLSVLPWFSLSISCPLFSCIYSLHQPLTAPYSAHA